MVLSVWKYRLSLKRKEYATTKTDCLENYKEILKNDILLQLLQVYRLTFTRQRRKQNVAAWQRTFTWSCHFQRWIAITPKCKCEHLKRANLRNKNPHGLVKSLWSFLFRWSNWNWCFLSWYAATMVLSSIKKYCFILLAYLSANVNQLTYRS